MTFDDTGYETNKNFESETFANMENLPAQIDIDGSIVCISSLEIDNHELAEALSSKSENERKEYLESVINYGVETMRIMNTTATAESLARVAEALATDFDAKREDFIESLDSLIGSMTAADNTNSITNVLEKWRAEFRDSLLKEFDPERANSIVGRFDALIEEKRKSESSDIAKRLDFNEPTSAVNMLFDKIRELVHSEVSDVNKNVVELSEKIAKKTVRDTKTTDRGNVFQREIFEIVRELSEIKGDIADDPGEQRLGGLAGNNEGDVTVALNPEMGPSNIFVYECKLRSSKVSQAAALKELDKGIANRGAMAGIIILQLLEGETKNEFDFFQECPDNRAILYIDPTNIDVNAVRYSYLWARLKCSDKSGKSLSTTELQDSIEKIKSAIKKCAQIRSNNTSAINSINASGEIVNQLEASIKQEILELTNMIDQAIDVEASA